MLDVWQSDMAEQWGKVAFSLGQLGILYGKKSYLVPYLRESMVSQFLDGLNV